MATLEAELALARANTDSQLRALSVLGAELERSRAAATGQATRLRLTALREAAEVSIAARGLRGVPPEAAESAVRALSRALDRLGAPGSGDGSDEVKGAEEAAAARSGVNEAVGGPPETSDGEAGRSELRSSNLADELAELELSLDLGDENGAAGAPPTGSGTDALDRSRSNGAGGRRISVDIGPFSDFSQLVEFEDAATSIAATGEISIRRFSAGRASIDVSLDEPIDLLAELERACDLGFSVRHSDAEQLILDVE